MGAGTSSLKTRNGGPRKAFQDPHKVLLNFSSIILSRKASEANCWTGVIWFNDLMTNGR